MLSRYGWSRAVGDARMDLGGHGVDPFDEDPDRVGELSVLLKQGLHPLGEGGVLLHHFDQHPGLLLQLRSARIGDLVKFFAMLRTCDAVGLVPVGLAGLRQKDQWRRVGGLGREGEVEQDEGIDVKLGPANDVDQDPDRHRGSSAPPGTSACRRSGRNPPPSCRTNRFRTAIFERGVRQMKSSRPRRIGRFLPVLIGLSLIESQFTLPPSAMRSSIASTRSGLRTNSNQYAGAGGAENGAPAASAPRADSPCGPLSEPLWSTIPPNCCMIRTYKRI